MIKNFFNIILNTEYLPMNEVRRLKVVLIMIFLILFTALSIPLSALLNYSFWVKFSFISGFVLLIFLTMIFLLTKKIFFAMQVTIIQSVLFMIFYTQGITSFYAYLLFYIVITIIALYQEVYSYFVYGSVVGVLGVFYILTEGDGLLLAEDITGAIYIYVVGLILYYIVNFIYILVNEKSYAEMNVEWINSKKTNDGIQEDIFNYMEALRKIDGLPPIYQDLDFQKAVFETSEFIAKQILKDGSEIKNIVDLYIYIHEKGFESILDNEEISINMKKTTDSLRKYIINDNSDLFSMVINFCLRDYQSTVDMNVLNVENLTEYKDEQVIAFSLIYVYIANNLYQLSDWNKIERKDDAKNLEDFDFEEFFDDHILAFYQDNQDIIKKHLKK
ncbi:hypothetical protein KHQ88_07145 [Mycoplasmatota bacterium]|nr:hypothetical protein KHQ88_07145 [Mycoplasmatota bacterium]